MAVTIWQAVRAQGREGGDRETQCRDCRRARRSDRTEATRRHRPGAADQGAPEGFGAFHRAEMEKWSPIIKAANIKPEG
jgi:hypothetical protein